MKFGGILILAVMGLLAFSFLWLLKGGVDNLRRGYSSTAWPAVDGVIASAAASVTGANINNRPTTSIHRTTLDIRYNVGAKAYTTEQVTWGQTLGTSDRTDAALLGLRYRVGQTVRLHYNPEKPSEAVVIPGLHATAFLLPGVALALLALVVPGIALGWSSLSGQDSQPHGADSAMVKSVRLVLVVFLIFGAALLVVGFRDLSLALKSESWPSTEGTWVKRITDDSDGPPAAAPKPLPPEARSGVEYIYRYSVNGIERYNNVREFGQGPTGGTAADEEIAARFPRDNPLKVYYDPADSDQSVLAPGITLRLWIIPGIGLVLFLIGTAALVGWNRAAPKKVTGTASARLTVDERPSGNRSPHRSGKKRRK